MSFWLAQVLGLVGSLISFTSVQTGSRKKILLLQLLCCVLWIVQYSLLGADLVCSGHAHGGIIRLPFTDGLVSHDLDLFPSYTAGLYAENGSVLFVTRGLGNSGPSFRVFNRPEVAVVTLRRAAD